MIHNPPEALRLTHLQTPIGGALLVTDEDGHVRALDFEDFTPRMMRLLEVHYGAVTLQAGAAPAAARERIAAYFGGELEALAGLACATGGSAFQRRVWAALREIPAGKTMNYGELAVRIGKPGAARAVGLANGANPIAVIVPCHRVIGANGTLTGYAGGLERKQWLLAHEGARAAAM